MILRELLARFSLQMDKGSVDKANALVNGFTKRLLGIGGALGVSFGGKALFNFGLGVKRAEFNLQRMAGTERFKALRKFFIETRKELNTLTKGAGDFVKQSEFDVAAAGFVKLFGRSNESLQQFKGIWEYSARKAALTGRSAGEIAQQMTEGIAGGGAFSEFLDSPGFDKMREMILQWRETVVDPKEPGGMAIIRDRAQQVMKLVQEVRAEQEKSLKGIGDKSFFQAGRGKTQLQQTLEDISSVLVEHLTPAIKALNEFLDSFRKKAKEVGKELGPGFEKKMKGLGFTDEKGRFKKPPTGIEIQLAKAQDRKRRKESGEKVPLTPAEKNVLEFLNFMGLIKPPEVKRNQVVGEERPKQPEETKFGAVGAERPKQPVKNQNGLMGEEKVIARLTVPETRQSPQPSVNIENINVSVSVTGGRQSDEELGRKIGEGASKEVDRRLRKLSLRPK